VAAVVEVVAAPVFGNLDGILAARRAAVAVGSSRSPYFTSTASGCWYSSAASMCRAIRQRLPKFAATTRFGCIIPSVPFAPDGKSAFERGPLEQEKQHC
jgi:hypothetical protein